jgi:undecaprenyl-diphosphatase
MGYWIAFLAALFETTIGIGLLIPGSAIILFMGALAARGYFDLGDLIWFAVIGAVLGDNINYFIGKKYGSKILSKKIWFIKPTYLKKGEVFFKNYGSKSVFIGRFIPSLKEVIPLISGTFGMKRTSFMIWNIIGAIGWSLIWVLPGYFFSHSLNFAKIWLTRAGLFLAIFIALLIVLYMLKKFLVKKGRSILIFIFSVGRSIKQAVSANPEVKKLTIQHKSFFDFLKKRLNKDNFYGLSLTLFSLALIYILMLFGGIIEDIVNSNIIVSADIRIANLLAIFRNPQLTKFFFWITFLGKWQVILIFTTAAILILWLWKKTFYIVPLLLCITGSQIFTLTGKFIFHRARPGAAIYPENSFSFPSGHASIAIAVYGFFTYLLIKNLHQWKRKIDVFFIGMILIMLIGFSRLYLGVHYVSDIWGGYLTGSIWLIIAIGFSEYLSSRNLKTEKPHQKTKKYLATTGILIISICLYVTFSINYKVPALELSEKIQPVTVNDPKTIFTTDQLKYTETILGDKQEPLSFIISAKNDRYLINFFKNSGWILADDVTISTIARLTYASFGKKSYPEAPMTPDFWNANVHDFGFEKETDLNNVRARHHSRFWKTNYTTRNGYNIYVGTASFDRQIKWGVVHSIDPDIDTEREFLFDDIKNSEMIADNQKYQFVPSRLGKNFSGDLFFTDGKLYLIFLK